MADNNVPEGIDEATYQKLLDDSKELERLKNAGTVSKEEYEKQVKALRAKLEEQEKERAKNRRDSFRNKLGEYLQSIAEDLNERHFDGIVNSNKSASSIKAAVESFNDDAIDAYLRDTVDGFDKACNDAKAKLHDNLKAYAEEYKAIENEVRRKNVLGSSDGTVAESYLSPPNVNALPETRRKLGNWSERTYRTDENRQKAGHSTKQQMELFILEQALGKPMTKPGTTIPWTADYQRIFQPVVGQPSVFDKQRSYIMNQAAAEQDFLGPNGKIFSLLNSEEYQKKLIQVMTSDPRFASETVMTTANTIQSLAIDFSGQVIMATWPLLIMKRIAAKTGVMLDKTKRVWEMGIPRSDVDPFSDAKHWFGAVDSATPTTLDGTKTLNDGTAVADAGSMASVTNGVPSEVWAYLGEAVDATTVITITASTPGSTTRTASVTFLTTDTVGTTKRFTEGNLGDKYIDVTAVTSSGWTTGAGNGEVGIFAPQPWREHTAGAQGDEVSFDIKSGDVTATAYNKVSRLTLEVMEDLENSVLQGNIDGPAMLLNLLQSALVDAIDSRGLYQMLTNTYSQNQRTFDATTPGTGFADQAWKAQLGLYMKDTSKYVHRNSGQMPDKYIWNFYDETSFNHWLTFQQGNITPIHPDANDPFAGGNARYKISGGEVWVSENQPTDFVSMCGGPLYGLMSFDYIPLKVLRDKDPGKNFEEVIMVRHRGFHGVAATDKIYGGKAIGYLKVTK